MKAPTASAPASPRAAGDRASRGAFPRLQPLAVVLGAPILDPHGGIMAVLDASTANSSDSRLIQRHTMALVNMSAHLISRWNFLNEFSQSWILRFHSRPEFVGLLHEALVAIDDAGNIWPSTKARWCSWAAPTANRWSASRSKSFFQFDFGRWSSAPIRAQRHLAGARSRAWPAFLCHRARAAAARRALGAGRCRIRLARRRTRRSGTRTAPCR
jgi:transcriptional regulator of acetoin/glycerol metabolism